MNLRIPQLQSRTSVIALSASMTLVGAGVGSYGLAIAHDYPTWLLSEPLFPIFLLLFGLGGIAIYLSSSHLIRTKQRRVFGAMTAAPLLFFGAIVALNGHPVSITWAVSTAVILGATLLSDDTTSESERTSLIHPYIYTILLGYGVLSFFFPSRHQSEMDIFLAAVSAAIGLAGILLLAKGHERALKYMRIFAGASIFVIIAKEMMAGSALIHTLLLAPIGLAACIHGYMRELRFGQPPQTGKEKEADRIGRFQDVTELNAWAVYIFALIHIFISPDLNGTLLFVLFIITFTSFVYQYRYRFVKDLNYRSYSRISMKNVILLAIVAHFTGGLLSPFNWFFTLTMLSGAVVRKRSHIYWKLAIITGYYLLESILFFVSGSFTPEIVADTILLQGFVIIVAGMYIQRVSFVQRDIDEDLMQANEKLAATVESERESKGVISSQAVELRQAQEQMERIVSSVTDGIVAVDDRGEIVFMNEAAIGMVRLASADLAGSMKELLRFRNDDPDAPDIPELVGGILQDGEAAAADDSERSVHPFPEETYFQAEDGTRRYLSGAVVDLGKGAGAVRIVITFRDVTYRHEIDQLKTDFMSLAAHQLRSPLSSIRWFLELLNDPSEGKLKKNQKMFTENAYSALLHMIDLINGLLAVTRVESSRVPSRPEPISIPKLTERLLKEETAHMKERGVSVHTKVDTGIPDVNLDPNLSAEVFRNLISNAVRYSSEKGEIVIAIEDAEDEIRWCVTDAGIGIPKAQQAHIFKKFYRASNATTHEAQGTGLGLYLAKYIAEQWGGRIWFESREGEGSTFHVTVPHAGMKAKGGEVSLHA